MWILQTSDDAADLGLFTIRMITGSAKTVGRAPTAGFMIDTGLISRLPCRLTVMPGGHLIVEDLDSTNGTFVNDRRVRRSALVTGDRLRLGRLELMVSQDKKSEV